MRLLLAHAEAGPTSLAGHATALAHAVWPDCTLASHSWLGSGARQGTGLGARIRQSSGHLFGSFVVGESQAQKELRAVAGHVLPDELQQAFPLPQLPAWGSNADGIEQISKELRASSPMSSPVADGSLAADGTPTLAAGAGGPLALTAQNVLQRLGPDQLGQDAEDLDKKLSYLKEDWSRRLSARRVAAMTVEDVSEVLTPLWRRLGETLLSAKAVQGRLAELEKAAASEPLLPRPHSGHGGAGAAPDEECAEGSDSAAAEKEEEVVQGDLPAMMLQGKDGEPPASTPAAPAAPLQELACLPLLPCPPPRPKATPGRRSRGARTGTVAGFF